MFFEKILDARDDQIYFGRFTLKNILLFSFFTLFLSTSFANDRVTLLDIEECRTINDQEVCSPYEGVEDEAPIKILVGDKILSHKPMVGFYTELGLQFTSRKINEYGITNHKSMTGTQGFNIYFPLGDREKRMGNFEVFCVYGNSLGERNIYSESGVETGETISSKSYGGGIGIGSTYGIPTESKVCVETSKGWFIARQHEKYFEPYQPGKIIVSEESKTLTGPYFKFKLKYALDWNRTVYLVGVFHYSWNIVKDEAFPRHLYNANIGLSFIK